MGILCRQIFSPLLLPELLLKILYIQRAKHILSRKKSRYNFLGLNCPYFKRILSTLIITTYSKRESIINIFFFTLSRHTTRVLT